MGSGHDDEYCKDIGCHASESEKRLPWLSKVPCGRFPDPPTGNLLPTKPKAEDRSNGPPFYRKRCNEKGMSDLLLIGCGIRKAVDLKSFQTLPQKTSNYLSLEEGNPTKSIKITPKHLLRPARVYE